MKKQILYYAIKYQGDYTRISNAVACNERWDDVMYDGKYITIYDAAYPQCLHDLKYRPWVLFYEGDLTLLNKAMIGIVGSRIISDYGKSCCREVVKYLNVDYGIVSGLARGVDGYAHSLSLSTQRKTIGVVGCGIDICYPKENEMIFSQMKNVGLILSEYPAKTKPLAHHFPWRNRILAALSKSVIVIEARKRSGTLITVNEALELGKDIYCFPHHYFDENGVGCNLLLQLGAQMIASLKDIEDI